MITTYSRSGNLHGDQLFLGVKRIIHILGVIMVWWYTHVQLLQSCLTTCTVAHQAPLSMGFSRQEYWSELPFPPPGDLPNPGIELVSLVSPALAGGFFTISMTWEAHRMVVLLFKRLYFRDAEEIFTYEMIGCLGFLWGKYLGYR